LLKSSGKISKNKIFAKQKQDTSELKSVENV
jgi:hypothetical protein